MRKILFGVLLALTMSAGAVVSGLVVHDHSSAGKGGSALNAVSLVVPGTLNINTSTGTLSSSKACDANFTRVGPNLCMKTTNSSNTASPGACTAVTLPTGAKALIYQTQFSVTSANAIAERFTEIRWHSNAACTAQIAHAFTSAREDPALAAGAGVISSNNTTVTVLAPAGGLWEIGSNNGGAGTTQSREIRGYYD